MSKLNKAILAKALMVVCIAASVEAATQLPTLSSLSTPMVSSQPMSLLSTFERIGDQADYIKWFIVSLCYPIGIGLCIGAIMKLKKYGTRTAFMAVETSLLGPSLQFIVGILLFYTSSFFKMINQTLYEEDKFATELSFDPQQTPMANYENYIAPIFSIIQIIGLISLIRGLIQLTKATNMPQSQPGMVSKGLTHVVGGALAINVYQLFNVIYYTLTP